MNIFQKIGNNIEREKKEKISMERKYWKLSSSERMEYDSKKDRILKRYNPFSMTVLFFKTLISISIFLLIYGATMGIFLEMIHLIRTLFFTFFKILWFMILADIILFFLNSLLLLKEKKELRKRFKLC